MTVTTNSNPISKLTDAEMAELYAMPLPELVKMPASRLWAFLKTDCHLGAGCEPAIVARIERALIESDEIDSLIEEAERMNLPGWSPTKDRS